MTKIWRDISESRSVPYALYPFRRWDRMQLRSVKTAAVFCSLLFLTWVPALADPFPVDQFKLELNRSIGKVNEFAFLREWGLKRRFPVYIAGGTAAGLGYRVRLLMEDAAARTHGSRDLKNRSSLNYFDIYRATQDVDVVIDADEAAARELEQALAQRFPYLQGDKSAWEVRLLRQTRGSGAAEKEPLLDNPNFLNQNTDSYSTGMIELTSPYNSKAIVRDLYDWNNRESPVFLHDLLRGQIHFYETGLHTTTKRYLAGLNPEILGAIRAVVKSSSYPSDLSAGDMEKIRRIVQRFDPASSGESSANALIKTARKLFTHSADLERTHDLLVKSGLDVKLKDLAKRQGDADLEYRLGRSPLRSYPIGQGPGDSPTGKTARDLGISDLAHDTQSIEAFESMAMSKRGYANVYLSVQGVGSERAIYGDAFYTMPGRKGLWGTGITVHLRLIPDAQEGRDFLRRAGAVLVLNRSVLEFIVDSGEVSPIALYRLLVSGDGTLSKDRGVLYRLKLRALASNVKPSAAQIAEIGGHVAPDYLRLMHDGDAIYDPAQWLKLGAAIELGFVPEEGLVQMLRVPREWADDSAINASSWSERVNRENLSQVDSIYFALAAKNPTLALETLAELMASPAGALKNHMNEWLSRGHFLSLATSVKNASVLSKERIRNAMRSLPTIDLHGLSPMLVNALLEADLIGLESAFEWFNGMSNYVSFTGSDAFIRNLAAKNPDRFIQFALKTWEKDLKRHSSEALDYRNLRLDFARQAQLVIETARRDQRPIVEECRKFAQEIYYPILANILADPSVKFSDRVEYPVFPALFEAGDYVTARNILESSPKRTLPLFYGSGDFLKLMKKKDSKLLEKWQDDYFYFKKAFDTDVVETERFGNDFVFGMDMMLARIRSPTLTDREMRVYVDSSLYGEYLGRKIAQLRARPWPGDLAAMSKRVRAVDALMKSLPGREDIASYHREGVEKMSSLLSTGVPAHCLELLQPEH